MWDTTDVDRSVHRMKPESGYGAPSIDCRWRELQILASLRISCQGRGVGEPHAAFFTESRTRGDVQRSLVGNPDFARDYKGWRGVSMRN